MAETIMNNSINKAYSALENVNRFNLNNLNFDFKNNNNVIKNLPQNCQYTIISSKTISRRLEIYKLWYEIYCLEMKRDLQRADHINQVMFDELEPHSQIVIAEVDNRIIGTLRLNNTEANFTSYYENLYEFNKFNLDEIVIGTKFMVHLNNRRNHFASGLINYALKYLKSIGKKYLIIDCSPAVYNFFEKHGFVQYSEEKNCSYYGTVKVMKYKIL